MITLMDSRLRRQLLGAAALSCLGGATPGLRAQGLHPGSLAPGPLAPGALMSWPAIALLDGSVLPPEAWRDTGAVIVFWATWCPFCKGHNPHVQKLHEALAGQPGRVLGVALDKDPELVRRHAAREGLRFPMAMDDGRLRALLSPRRVVPLTCVIDRSGRLRQTIPGEMFEEDVLELGKLALSRG